MNWVFIIGWSMGLIYCMNEDVFKKWYWKWVFCSAMLMIGLLLCEIPGVKV